MNRVCFDRSFFVLFLVLITGVAVYYHINLTSENQRLYWSLKRMEPRDNNTKTNLIVREGCNNYKEGCNDPPHRRYDRRVVSDKLTAPRRRDEYGWSTHPLLVPTYTQGPPVSFRRMGMLTDETATTDYKYKFLLLIGREKYRRGPFEYYAVPTVKDDNIKFTIDNTRELFSGDTITIEQLGRKYNVAIDKPMTLDYHPDILW